MPCSPRRRGCGRDTARAAAAAWAATSALRQKSPAKGIAFEEELVAALQPWKQGSRASVEHVGADNRQGDVVVRFPPTHAQRQQQQQQQQQTQTQYHQQQQEQFQQQRL